MPKMEIKREGLKMLKEITKGKAKYPVISECPVCNHDLIVEGLVCENCGTRIEGQFTLSKFNYLDTEKLYFIEVFVKNRGNIKAVEKEMDLSYPTIKKMLDDVIAGLGYQPDSVQQEEQEQEEKDENQSSRLDILEKLNSGALKADEAAEMLKKLKARRG
ncbi:MAG TPA: DUF2089 domain-containing protein [Bacillota bacterium]|nr:DUF2089 domain-containing protein [Bacillota bacterium]HPQ61740.1 DUF2089 domain-containing protein [Bacillota bacterium]HRX91273.1 DUF2089 domain-containing protein [Candidatus Izemoplasmatales bacterium]